MVLNWRYLLSRVGGGSYWGKVMRYEEQQMYQYETVVELMHNCLGLRVYGFASLPLLMVKVTL